MYVAPAIVFGICFFFGNGGKAREAQGQFSNKTRYSTLQSRREKTFPSKHNLYINHKISFSPAPPKSPTTSTCLPSIRPVCMIGVDRYHRGPDRGKSTSTPLLPSKTSKHYQRSPPLFSLLGHTNSHSHSYHSLFAPSVRKKERRVGVLKTLLLNSSFPFSLSHNCCCLQLPY